MDVIENKDALETVLLIDSSLYIKERSEVAGDEFKSSPDHKATLKRLRSALEKTLVKVRSEDRAKAIPLVFDLMNNELKSRTVLKFITSLLLKEQLKGELSVPELKDLVERFQEMKETGDRDRKILAADYLVDSHAVYFTKPENSPLGRFRLNILSSANISDELFKAVLENIEGMVERNELSQEEMQEIVYEIRKLQDSTKITAKTQNKVQYMMSTIGILRSHQSRV